MTNKITTDDFENAYPDYLYDLNIKDKRIVVLMKIAGVLTLLSSFGVGMECLYDHWYGKSTVISRTQFFFQIPIVMFAMVHFVGSWVAPQGTPGWNNRGNIATCETFGFLKQFSISLLPLDMWITTCHVLIVRYGWKEDRLSKWEKFVHVITWPVGLLAAIFPLVNDNLNLTYDLCGMYSAPYDCDEEEGCLRGHENTWKAHVVISTINIISVVYAIFAMISIYLYVRKLENNIGRYSSSSLTLGIDGANNNTNVSRARSRAVAIQGILYSLATLCAFLPSALEMLLWFVGGYEAYWIYTLHRFFAPMIGTFNMMVFFRNRTKMHTRYGKILQKLTSWCCCGTSSTSFSLPTLRSSSPMKMLSRRWGRARTPETESTMDQEEGSSDNKNDSNDDEDGDDDAEQPSPTPDGLSHSSTQETNNTNTTSFVVDDPSENRQVGNDDA